jgi:hypothetical protein
MELKFDEVDVAEINKVKKRHVALIYAHDKDSQVQYRLPYFLEIEKKGYAEYEFGQPFKKTKDEKDYKSCEISDELLCAADTLYKKNRVRVITAKQNDKIKLRR